MQQYNNKITLYYQRKTLPPVKGN